ncbi:MAG: glycoside hydrolase family 97 N-terminal domain-containing protein, partial [Actinobacteria bacterium]|nr:glycoside hydrolase family 97 N-terminal domain-containing protein [Actinomycetota bacterium]
MAGEVDYPDARNVYYRVEYDGAEVLLWSPLGIRTEEANLVDDLVYVGESRRTVSESYEMAVGKSRRRGYQATELTLEFENEAGRRIDFDFRVADHGVAYRLRLVGEGESVAVEEASGFRVPGGAQGWMLPYDRATIFTPAYEEFYRQVEAGETNAQYGWSFAALFRLADAPVYLLLAEAALERTYAGTHLGQPVETLYRIAYPGEGEGIGVGEPNPRSTLPWTTPWRAVAVGGLDDIVRSTLVDDLSPPPGPGFEDGAEWVRPGRSAWSWYSQGTGSPALQREYVDFAADIGWEYVLVDAAWDTWPNPDQD